MSNTRFSVAVHILTLLAYQPDEPGSSAWLAGSVNTHAAFIRRILGDLGRAGLTRSRMGPRGGALLARDPASITLADVYAAVAEEREVISVHAAPNPRCPVGKNIQSVLDQRIERVERAVRAELADTTIADLVTDIARSA